jgi:hypothetical protein
MAGSSNYPNGIGAGLTIREIPIHTAYPGKVFWVYNGTALLGGQRGGSDGNKGTFNSPFATVAYAITQCTANRGDVIMVKAGHTETISDATTFAPTSPAWRHRPGHRLAAPHLHLRHRQHRDHPGERGQRRVQELHLRGQLPVHRGACFTLSTAPRTSPSRTASSTTRPRS